MFVLMNRIKKWPRAVVKIMRVQMAMFSGVVIMAVGMLMR